MQNLLDPAVLNAISGLDLVAATVVDGFVAGLHRSADFGFSQEFAEYRAYALGDDLRHVDWNVYARSDRTYIKRFHGETNSQLMLLVDASNSMGFATHAVTKLGYVRFIAAALAYLATRRQRDATGLVVFGDTVRDFVAPASRQGHLQRVLASLVAAQPQSTTSYAAPLTHLQGFLRRRGMVVVMSDFYAPPADIIRAVEPLRIHGNEVVLFQVLDPGELRPQVDGSSMLVDLETGATLEVSADYVRGRYRERIEEHVSQLRREARRAGIGYQLLPTDQPLDQALAQYLRLRTGRD
ncbi:MAG TPA: DUF58 domain-containing protein [Steroidobacteraceae bacterium]|nr:DUF58 domain-containing protein [Steroidobacteraceae bacterium]